MALQVSWTENALEDYEKIVNYLIKEWSFPIAENFVALLEKRLETLSHLPYLGISSGKQPGVRSISITKHNRLFYRLSSGIEVLAIFDTRQNPEKNSFD